ncbi:MAG TPA: hypothetical protein VHU80_21855 [Polyangiaceae bacterium]|jgi:hypothetical protein|nr:hypothetical protein [Polyangiaceae bacterium]
MTARPARIPGAAPVPRIVLLRRRQQVVVRAPDAAERTVVVRPPRPKGKTLAGLGPNERAFREEADTLPAPSNPLREHDETPPVSGVRLRAPVESRVSFADMTPRPRPVTLIDGVHDDMSRDLLEEAKRLLASGIFERREDV